MSAKGTFSRDAIARDLRALGLPTGALVNVKASLRSIGRIDGGPNALIGAILDVIGPEGTVVTDSFVRVFPLPLSKADSAIIVDQETPSYAGALANAMIRYPGALRSTHPVQKFAAVGRLARDLIEAHGVDSEPYGVLRQMAEMGGSNLKIGPDSKVVGVGTTHVAVELLGLHQDRPRAGVNYRDQEGVVRLFERTWSGGCRVGFNRFLPAYEEAGAVLAEGSVGRAPAKLTDMKKTLQAEVDILRRDPQFFLCDDPACVDCRLGWTFSTGNRLSVFLHRAKRKLVRGLGGARA